MEPECSLANDDLEQLKPVERQIVSRADAPLNGNFSFHSGSAYFTPTFNLFLSLKKYFIAVGDPPVSAVRVLRFFHTNILSTASRTDSLWVGTNGGTLHLQSFQQA